MNRDQKMSKKTALTPEQVRANLRAQGKTVASWARDHDFRLQDVYRVMGGQYKGYYGKAHDIAVALGLKPSIPDDERNPQTRRVA
jgi:gp16 family phage-associated protein